MQFDSSTCRTVVVIGKPVNLAAREGKALIHYSGRQRKPNIFIPQQGSRVRPLLLMHLVNTAHDKKQTGSIMVGESNWRSAIPSDPRNPD